MKLYFSPKYQRWYYSEEESLRCKFCNLPITVKGLVNYSYNKLLGDEIKIICTNGNCVCKIDNSKAEDWQTNLFHVTQKKYLPLDVKRIIFKPINLGKTSNLSEGSNSVSVFQAADSKYDKYIGSDTSSYQLNDKTRLAGRESWQGAKIGCAETAKQIEQKDKILLTNEESVGTFLDNLKEAKPMIEERKTKRIEE